MNLLLDTHIVLWWLDNDSRLSTKYINLLSDSSNFAYISSATIWEISIKTTLGKLSIPPAYLQELRREGFIELPISWYHCNVVRTLPPLHSDPFDRILIAQAQTEALTLLTVNTHIKRYQVAII